MGTPFKATVGRPKLFDFPVATTPLGVQVTKGWGFVVPGVKQPVLS